MLTHPKAPPGTPSPLPPTPTLRSKDSGLGHVVKPVPHRQPVTPAAAPTPWPQPGEAPALPGCSQCCPFSSVLAAEPMGKGGVGTAGDQARTVPGLSLVWGLQTGLAVPVSMER